MADKQKSLQLFEDPVLTASDLELRMGELKREFEKVKRIKKPKVNRQTSFPLSAPPPLTLPFKEEKKVEEKKKEEEGEEKKDKPSKAE